MKEKKEPTKLREKRLKKTDEKFETLDTLPEGSVSLQKKSLKKKTKATTKLDSTGKKASKTDDKTPDLAVKKLKIIADNVDSIPMEHLLDAMEELKFGISDEKLNQYAEALVKNPESTPYLHPTLSNEVLQSREVQKSLDKIYRRLNLSDSYKEMKTQLDRKLVEKLESNPDFKKLMKEKLSGNKEKIEELFDIVVKAKTQSIKEVTGVDVGKMAAVDVKREGRFIDSDGLYKDGVVTMNEKPFSSFFSTKKGDNKEILNTMIHELTHYDQDILVKETKSPRLESIKDDLRWFSLNKKLYLDSSAGKKYKRQPIEKEAFKTGDGLAKELRKKVSAKDLKSKKRTEEFDALDTLPERSVSKNPEMKEKIKRVGEFETTQKWKNLKTAANIRYVQKMAHDRDILEFIKKKKEKAESEDLDFDDYNFREVLNTKTSRGEENEIIRNLAEKKQTAFNEAAKLKDGDTAPVLFRSTKEMKNSGGKYSKTRNLIRMRDDERLLTKKLGTIDHEVVHKYQRDLVINQDLQELSETNNEMDDPDLAEWNKQSEMFKFDIQNYTSKDREYYDNSILERDANEDKKITEKGLAVIDQVILENRVPRDKQGYVYISNPEVPWKDQSNKFLKGHIDLKSESKKMKLLSQNMDKVKETLSQENLRKLEGILGSYNELQNLEKEGKVGVGSRDIMLETLSKNLQDLTAENKDFEKKVKKIVKGKGVGEKAIDGLKHIFSKSKKKDVK